MGGSFIPSGNLIQIVVPPALKKYPDVASRYENVTFSRKTATRKKNVDLLGIGHPLIDALINHYKSDAVKGELLRVKLPEDRSSLTARNLFIIEFEDGNRREEYHNFLLQGETTAEDLDFLFCNDFKPGNGSRTYPDVENKLEMFIQNQKAIIKSEYEGVVNIRHKCVGIRSIN